MSNFIIQLNSNNMDKFYISSIDIINNNVVHQLSMKIGDALEFNNLDSLDIARIDFKHNKHVTLRAIKI